MRFALLHFKIWFHTYVHIYLSNSLRDMCANELNLNSNNISKKVPATVPSLYYIYFVSFSLIRFVVIVENVISYVVTYSTWSDMYSGSGKWSDGVLVVWRNSISAMTIGYPMTSWLLQRRGDREGWWLVNECAHARKRSLRFFVVNNYVHCSALYLLFLSGAYIYI